MQIDSSGKEKINILDFLLEELKTDGVQTPPNMRNCDRRNLKCVTRKVEKVAQYFKVKNLGQMSNFLKAAVNEKLERLETDNSTIPDAEESREYWDSIWSKQVKQLEKDRARIEKQSDIEITPEMIAKRANKLPNWKAPGPDGLQGTG